VRTAELIADLIVQRLGNGGASHLILLVSVRKGLNSTPVRGDLSAAVASALRRLVEAGSVTDDDGVYSLAG
jgi:hypothetical protein